MNKISSKATVYELMTSNPEIIDIMVELGFKDIVKPGMIQSMGRFMSLEKGAKMKRIPMERMKETFREHGYELD